MDAKIRSIEKKHDGLTCNCEFYISFYVDQGPDLYLINKKLSRATTMVTIDQISVLQRLELKPYESQYYRWGYSEDCFSVQKFKLFSGMFCSDLSWLIVASVLKQTAFDIRSMKSHIVYEVSEYNPERGQTDSPSLTYCVSLKAENEVLTPSVVQIDLDTLEERAEEREVGLLCSYDPTELRRSKRRIVQPERYLGCDKLPDYEIEVTRLGESKTYMKECDETSSEEEDFELPLALSVQADNDYQLHRDDENWIKSYKGKSKDNSVSKESDIDSDTPKRKKSKKSSMSKYLQKLSEEKEAQEEELAIVTTDGSPNNASSSLGINFKVPEENSKEIGDMVSQYFYMNGFQSSQKRKTFDFMDVDSGGKKGPKATRRKYHRISSHNTSIKRDCFYVRESIYDVRSFRKDSVTAQLCRELIRRCMNNIDATLKNEPVQPPVVEQWKEHQSKKNTEEKEPDEKPPINNEEEISEIDMLWKEMEVALASWYLLDDNEVQFHNLVQFSHAYWFFNLLLNFSL